MKLPSLLPSQAQPMSSICCVFADILLLEAVELDCWSLDLTRCLAKLNYLLVNQSNYIFQHGKTSET